MSSASNRFAPRADGCVIVRVCVETVYSNAGTTQNLPPLPAWAATEQSQRDCAVQFGESGGYGEMSISGVNEYCTEYKDHVFHRLYYCPKTCTDPDAASKPEC